jgi:hypothetical protein
MRKDKPRADAGLEPEPARPAREFVSIAEALATYGISRSFLYELMGRELVRSAKLGRRRLIHAPTLRALVLSGMDGAAGHGRGAERVRREEVVRPGGDPGRRGKEAVRHGPGPGGPEGRDRPAGGNGGARPAGGGGPDTEADAPRTLRNRPAAAAGGRRRP